MAEFQHLLQKTIQPMKKLNRSVFLGDFNIDTFNIDSPLEKSLKKIYFTRSLAAGLSTTNNDTQIDIIFTRNIHHWQSGVYETYFSDHKPIYIGINNVKFEKITENVIASRDCNVLPVKTKTVPNVKKHTPSAIKLMKIPSDIIATTTIDLDVEMPNKEVTRTNAQIAEEKKEQILHQVLTPQKCLTTDTMELIGELIKSKYPYLNFQSPFCVVRCNYKNVPRENDDIQFLFEDPPFQLNLSSSLDCNSRVGHWICIYYCSIENKVYVYDSYIRNKLTYKHKQCIRKLYPAINLENDLIYERLKNKQNDPTSCGVYAAAFAISKALRENLQNINLKTSRPEEFIGHANEDIDIFDESFEMRKHLAEIISNGELRSFPQNNVETHLNIKSINQIAATNVHLTDDTMDIIGNIISRNYPDRQYDFQHAAIGMVQQYRKRAENRDDMQFLFEGPNGPNTIGHWIFVYFVSETRKLHIYNI